MKTLILFGCLLACLISSCTEIEVHEVFTPTVANIQPLVVDTATPMLPASDEGLVTLVQPPDPADWRDWPVVPTIATEMVAVYQRGQELGNNPRTFSKIGDGEISAVWFFTNFDLKQYELGEYAELQAVIDQFSGSFSRHSQAARRGFNTTLILDSSKTAPNICTDQETPLDCELRLHRPSFAFISLGTNQVWQPEIFEAGLRQIVEKLLEQGVIPILSTKGDNLEGDHRINGIIAQLASEYHVPLWNFWRVIQPLPSHGLQEDLEHLTYAPVDFSNPYHMQAAWPWRNLTALQVLDAVWQVHLNERP